MAEWQIRVLAEGPPSQETLTAAQMRAFDGALSALDSGRVQYLDRSYEVVFKVSNERGAADVFTAACETLGAIRERVALPDWAMSRIEVSSRFDTPSHDGTQLMGIREIADLLGVSASRASHLSRRGDFPSPEVVLACGPIWRRSRIAGFAEAYHPRPGRPPRPRDDEPAP